MALANTDLPDETGSTEPRTTPLRRICDAANEALEAEISIVPAMNDGSKRPCGRWKPFQAKRAQSDQFVEDFRNGCGLGVITGEVSGGLEVLDFDRADMVGAFFERAKKWGLHELVDRVAAGYSESSPNGFHLLYRCEEIEGNQKLAGAPDPDDSKTIKTLIETRGEGGFCIVAPSNGTVHPSGLPYQIETGGFAKIVTLTPLERSRLLDLARTFDERPKPPEPEPEAERPRADHAETGGGRPGDDFNERGGWDFLTEAGWTLAQTRDEDGVGEWRRPGKTDEGISATTDHEPGMFYVFTTSTDFENDRGFSRFTAYAMLHHGGNFGAAAKALRAKGYGDGWSREEPHFKGTGATHPDGEDATDPNKERFTGERTSIGFVFDSEPSPREYLIPGLMPAHESGLIVAAGGTGKGHFQMALTVALALGFPFAGFDIQKPRGVVLVSVEDDRNEMHRRLRAAFDMTFRDKRIGWEDVRDLLERRIRIVDLRGTTGVRLGSDMLELLLPVVDRVDDPGFISLDPMSRILPDLRDTGGLNTQEGAGIVLNELDAIRTATGCTVLGSHHVSKEAIRNNGELTLTAATGSQQLVDLSRWVMNLKRLSSTEIAEYKLARGHYLEAAVTKTNYSPPLDTPIVFQRGEGGALEHVMVESRQAHDEDVALAILRSLGDWTSSEDWRNAGPKADQSLPKNRVDIARKTLFADGRIERVETKRGRTRLVFYAPADWRETGWPAQPEDEE